MATHRRLIKKRGPDFYVTPDWATQALVDEVRLSGNILEPCCGDGAMSEVLKTNGFRVRSSDLYDRGYGRVQDIFKIKAMADNVVTNPPFNIAEEVLHHALKLANKKVCLLLRTAFLESAKRYETVFTVCPPTEVLVFSERLSIYPRKLMKKKNNAGATSYAWFVWDKAKSDAPTTIRWIPPREYYKAVDVEDFE
jgi:hypothetical protein